VFLNLFLPQHPFWSCLSSSTPLPLANTCVTTFLYYMLLFSLHTRHRMTIWVHLLWKDLSICWVTTWNLIPSCLHVELPKTVSIFIDRYYWLYFFCSVSSNNLIHLKWCEAIIRYTLTHQLSWHFQVLLHWVTLVGGHILVALNVTVEIIVVQVIFKPI